MSGRSRPSGSGRLAGRHAAFAHPAFGFACQGIRLGVQAGGAEVLDRGVQVLHAALDLGRLTLRTRPVARSFAQLLQHLAAFAFQTLDFLAIAGFARPLHGRLELFQAAHQRLAIARLAPWLGLAQLGFDPRQRAAQLARVRILFGTQRFQLAADVGGLLLQLAAFLHQLRRRTLAAVALAFATDCGTVAFPWAFAAFALPALASFRFGGFALALRLAAFTFALRLAFTLRLGGGRSG